VNRTSTGIPARHDNPLRISAIMLRSLTDAGLVHSRMGAVYGESRAHHSIFMEYDRDNTTPVAMRMSHLKVTLTRSGYKLRRSCKTLESRLETTTQEDLCA
jgi:hypothetical protein